MRVSYRWLNEYIDLSGVSARELAELMTRGGIEIDTVESLNKGVSSVVVGYVKSKEKHPDADKLNVCKVDAGGPEELQIVCGAANVAAGQKVPVALVGAKLPGGMAIKRAKLRGVESQGMICSAKELGMNEKLLPKEQQEGILVLPPTLAVGTPVGEALGLEDEVLELDLTPNRSDCLSMLGVAYEAGALTGRPVKLPETAINGAAERAADHIAVRIDAPAQCLRYAARYIKGVKIAPSPQWMQNRLVAAGIRPINNVVDITNYVMLEYGQPLHAFDADKVADGRIEVRLARAGETIVTLDGQERKLEPHMLVIADGAGKPVALAGVMGGADAEVTADTVNILLESAKFDGATVRKTSRQLGLRSESSLRFEKGVDYGRVVPALDRAALLMAQYAEGLVADGVIEEIARAEEPVEVEVALARINRFLGTALSGLEVRTIFDRLGFDCDADDEERFSVRVPSRRGDIVRGVDLIEEVARLRGYDNIPTTPIEGSTTPGSLTVPQAIRRALRERLTGAGMHEVVTYSVTHPARTRRFNHLSGDVKPIRLALPMSEDRSVLRTSLLPNLLEAAVYNRNYRTDNLALFEIGAVFLTDEETLTRLPQERQRLAGLLAGSRVQPAWNRAVEPVDFYDAKGMLDAAFALVGLDGRVFYEAAELEGLHPGRTAVVRLNGSRGPETIGYVGQLHPELQREEDLADTYVFELELDAVYEQADFAISARSLPRYPAIERDIAVALDEAVEASRLTAEIREAAGDLLESVEVFDVYTGEKLGAGKKSVALTLVYRHAERTLTDEEVSERHAAVVERLAQSFAAELRK